MTLVVQSNASANVPPVTNWELLTRHNQLRHLTLSGCSLDDAAATAIGDTLSGNSSLFHLNLWQNRIGDKGAAALAAGLRRNRTLSSLDLGSNAIGDVGVVSLAAVLGDLRLTHAEVVERRRALASAAAPTEVSVAHRQTAWGEEQSCVPRGMYCACACLFGEQGPGKDGSQSSSLRMGLTEVFNGQSAHLTYPPPPACLVA